MTEFTRQVRTATEALRDLFDPTPLQLNDHLSSRYAAEIYLKREDLTPVRSYKLRGAFTAMRAAILAGKRTFVCASAGNHAQGMAYACRHFGAQGVVFMPVTTPQQKIDKTRTFGGDSVEIRLMGDYFDRTLAAAQSYAAEVGAHFLSPFDDQHVIEGQASVAVEMLDQFEGAPDIVILPVGGGGLAAGITSYLAEAAPGTVIYYVEPQGAACLRAALAAGEPVTLKGINNFVDGAAVARIGSRTFERLNGIPAERVLISPEDRICITMIEFLNVEGIVLEPAGALAVDALPSLAELIRGKRVVCITSGGNFDFERLPEVKERANRFAGLKKYFILRMPQRPGALKEFLNMLGPDDDIARFEYLKKSARNFGSVLIGIETKEAVNFSLLKEKLDAAEFTYRDITDDDALAEFLI